MDNLIGLCRRHHRLVHEGGWTVLGNADLEVVFIRPDGRRRTSVTPPLDPHVWRRARRARRAAERRRRRDEARTREWWKAPPG